MICGDLMQGHPIRVDFAGFQSDTYRMYRAGWEMAADEDPFRRDEMRVMFRHRESRMLMRGVMHDYRYMLESRLALAWQYKAPAVDSERFSIEIFDFGQLDNYYVRTIHDARIDSYRWRDMTPSFGGCRDVPLHSLPLFKERDAPVDHELIVDANQVQQALDAILKAQAPGMREIRARDRKRDTGAKQVHAQIISIAA